MERRQNALHEQYEMTHNMEPLLVDGNKDNHLFQDSNQGSRDGTKGHRYLHHHHHQKAEEKATMVFHYKEDQDGEYNHFPLGMQLMGWWEDPMCRTR